MAVVTLGPNILALSAQRYLAGASDNVRQGLERLSSGLRINRASDDAAGLAVSSRLNSDSRVYAQGVRNLNDGISLLNIAQSTVGNLSDIVTRLKELAESSANGTFSLTQRRSLDAEASALTKEFNRLLVTSNFNGIHLLDGALSGVTLQGGVGSTQTLSFDLGKNIRRNVGTGSFGAVHLGTATAAPPNMVASGDFNGDGRADMVSTDGVIAFGAADGTFVNSSSYGASATGLDVGDINGDGKLDIVTTDGTTARTYLGNGSGGFTAGATISSARTRVALGDVSGDGRVDVVLYDGGAATAISVGLGTGSGTFNAVQTVNTASPITELHLGDLDGNGSLEIATDPGYSQIVFFKVSQGGAISSAGSFTPGGLFDSFGFGDFNHDGIADLGLSISNGISVYSGNGNGTFGSGSVISGAQYGDDLRFADLNGDGNLDILSFTYLGQFQSILNDSEGQGRFTVSSLFGSPAQPDAATLGDVNGDGVLDIIEADDDNVAYGVGVLLGNSTSTLNTSRLNLLSQESARQSLASLATLLSSIGGELGNIGAAQSRTEIALSHLQNLWLNYRGASDRITSADVASEAGNLARSQILQQSAAAVLAQANQAPALALALLKTV